MGLTASVRPESLLNVWTDYSRASQAFIQPMPNLSACNCHLFVCLQVLFVFYHALYAFFFILLIVVCDCWCVGSQRGPQMMAVLAGNQIDRKPKVLREIMKGAITGTPTDEMKCQQNAGTCSSNRQQIGPYHRVSTSRRSRIMQEDGRNFSSSRPTILTTFPHWFLPSNLVYFIRLHFYLPAPTDRSWCARGDDYRA